MSTIREPTAPKRSHTSLIVSLPLTQPTPRRQHHKRMMARKAHNLPLGSYIYWSQWEAPIVRYRYPIEKLLLFEITKNIILTWIPKTFNSINVSLCSLPPKKPWSNLKTLGITKCEGKQCIKDPDLIASKFLGVPNSTYVDNFYSWPNVAPQFSFSNVSIEDVLES